MFYSTLLQQPITHPIKLLFCQLKLSAFLIAISVITIEDGQHYMIPNL